MAQSIEETQQVDQSPIPFSTRAFSDPPTPFSLPSEEREHNQHKAYLMSFPPGYRFCPTDEELIRCYLTKKVKNEKLPPSIIVEENIYLYDPESLAAMYQDFEGKYGWYFFTPRDRKYPNGTRPKRSAADGYWKATGSDKSIYHNGSVSGFKKALVFYVGKAPKGEKTNWIMNEYRMNKPPRTRVNSNDMRLDDWVLCKIHKKNENTRRKKDDEDMDQRTEDGAHNNEINETVAEFNPNVLDASQTMAEAINWYNPPPIQASASISPPHPQLLRYPFFTSMEEQFMQENMYHSRPTQFDPSYNNYSNASRPTQQTDPLYNNYHNTSRYNYYSNVSWPQQIDLSHNSYNNASRSPQIDLSHNNSSDVSGPPQIDPLHSNKYYNNDEHQCNYSLPENFANDPLNNPLWGICADADYQSKGNSSRK